MERKKASDFPQELLNLFDGYVHGRMSRREFLDGAQKFAVGGVTAAALNYLEAPTFSGGNIIEQIANLSFVGSLPDQIKSPWATDKIGMSIGAEYRREHLDSHSDVPQATGDVNGNGKADTNTIEQSAEACATAGRRLHRLVEADLHDWGRVAAGLGDTRFDGLIFSDVLEHVYDPRGTVVARTDLGTREILQVEAGLAGPPPPYARLRRRWPRLAPASKKTVRRCSSRRQTWRTTSQGPMGAPGCAGSCGRLAR